MPDFVAPARSFLAGESLYFREADKLFRELRKADKLPLGRAFLSRVRQGRYLTDGLAAGKIARLLSRWEKS
jgi:hypothetical protein